MKQTGTCPKCGSIEVKGFIKVMGQSAVHLGISARHSATLEALACANCGYIEFYSDTKGLENIRSHAKPYAP